MTNCFSIRRDWLMNDFDEACDDPKLRTLAHDALLAAAGSVLFEFLLHIRQSGMDTHPKIEPIWKDLDDRVATTRARLEAKYPDFERF